MDASTEAASADKVHRSKTLETTPEKYATTHGKGLHTDLSLRSQYHPRINCAGTSAIEVALVVEMRKTATVER